ncbi:hypothetical protein JHL18_21645 [Clostridium sp. YIM B02505]|uniref:Uncharacterized protein n=1 Tax=Clostridium yunnanense TaxID=2800325 RepID=A0ABS1EV32_9CLOT|nr:hypothetical protein [Clostridium yunnanense]MBK1813229.1 hypothetical protein [Clostridium yunnanense]
MECLCKEESFDLKLQANLTPDPLGCERCDCIVDMDDMSLSDELRREIRIWLYNYSELVSKQVTPEDLFKYYQQHNNRGVVLAERIEIELGDKFKVSYYPS